MLVYLRDGSAYNNWACCRTEIQTADQTFCLSQSQCTDTGSTSPSADPIQGCHWTFAKITENLRVLACWLVGCLTSQQHASVSQGRICSDNFTCCHTEIQVADQTFHLTQSQYTDTGPTSPSADPISPGAWQGSHLSTNV